MAKKKKGKKPLPHRAAVKHVLPIEEVVQQGDFRVVKLAASGQPDLRVHSSESLYPHLPTAPDVQGAWGYLVQHGNGRFSWTGQHEYEPEFEEDLDP